MQDLKLQEQSWINAHRDHCAEFSQSALGIRKRVESSLAQVESLYASESRYDTDLSKNILDRVAENLIDKIDIVAAVGLLCSGGEDSVFLLIVLVRILGVRPKLFCYQTKNNLSDVSMLRKIADKCRLELFIYDSISLDRESSYNAFLKLENRQPNDLAQPVHNALYFQAKNVHKCDFVVDGQFCDTVLLSNPQNFPILGNEPPSRDQVTR